MQRKEAQTDAKKFPSTGPVKFERANEVQNDSINKILRSMPFYGGTQPGTTVPAAQTSPVTPEPTPEPTPQTQPPADGGSDGDDPIAKLAADPEAINKLLAQVDSLQKDLKDAQTKVSAYDEEKQKAERAQQTREQQLESDLAQRDAVIQQMDTVIKNMAINNAMMSQKDLRWNSVKQAVAELNPEAFELEVDLEKGRATVNGIEQEAQRIAREFPWLVANSEPQQPQTPRTPRKSGGPTPPSPPNGDTSKADRRNKLMKKYPVLGTPTRVS